MTPVKLQISFW